MSNIPAQVLLGTPKEATAYIYQIRAMRKASPTLVNTLNTAFAKQAYSWEDFKKGLTTYSPTSYGLAGAGAGGLIAAVNEQRKDERHRNYLNILRGAVAGGGLGAGGALIAEKVDLGNLLTRATGNEEPQGAGQDPTPEQEAEINIRNTPPPESNRPGGPMGYVHDTLSLALKPGQTVLDTLGVPPETLARYPLLPGLVGTAGAHSTLSGLHSWGNTLDRNRFAADKIRRAHRQQVNALPEAIRHTVTDIDVPMTAGSPALAPVLGIPPGQTIPHPTIHGATQPITPVTGHAGHGVIKPVPVDAAARRLVEVQDWLNNTPPVEEIRTLLDGGEVQISGKPFKYDDLAEVLGDRTITPVSGAHHQFEPGTLSEVTHRTIKPRRGPQWLEDLRNKLPGRGRTVTGRLIPPTSVVHGVHSSINPTDIPKSSWRGHIGRNKALRYLSNAPLVAGIIAQIFEARRTRGQH